MGRAGGVSLPQFRRRGGLPSTSQNMRECKAEGEVPETIVLYTGSGEVPLFGAEGKKP